MWSLRKYLMQEKVQRTKLVLNRARGFHATPNRALPESLEKHARLCIACAGAGPIQNSADCRAVRITNKSKLCFILVVM